MDQLICILRCPNHEGKGNAIKRITANASHTQYNQGMARSSAWGAATCLKALPAYPANPFLHAFSQTLCNTGVAQAARSGKRHSLLERHLAYTLRRTSLHVRLKRSWP